MDNFKGDFLNLYLFVLFFFARSDSRFSNSCISAKYRPNLTKTIHQWKAYVFSYKFRNIDTLDWFCGPVCVCVCVYIYIYIYIYTGAGHIIRISSKS